MQIHNLTEEQKKAAKHKHVRRDFPFVWGISLGEWPCNLSCRMCPMYTKPVRTTRMIADDVFYRACDEIGDRRVSLEISGFGETFQHPKSDTYIAEARARCPRASIVIVTNGTMLNRERCERIVDSGINQLQLSLDAGSAETYEWLTGSKKYDQVCRNLETLAEVKNARGADHLKIHTHIIGIKELAHEFDGFIERWKDVVDHVAVRPFGNWAGMVDGNGVTPSHTQRIPDQRYPCAWLWYATKIEPNGDVSKCFIHVTGDDNPVGNIMKQSIEEIWRGEKIEALRRLHCENRHNEVEHCQNCIVWSLFCHFWDRRNGHWLDPLSEPEI